VKWENNNIVGVALWKALTAPSTKLLLIGPTFQSVSHHDAELTIIFAWSRQNHRAWLQWPVSRQLTHVALYRLIATVEAILGD
jgi:hypothetical protein